ncbi:hypothetical protein [Lacipirellula sp.]|uniref:hypothetical protein n=1 Tax=Lacipirellula sp. TaxID=2691419 RepID=UPI003D0D564B
MRRVRRFAVLLSLAVACVAFTGCSPDRHSGMSQKPESAAVKTAAETSSSQPTVGSAARSYSEQTPESAAVISGLEMPDSKSMLITDEAMTSSLSAPVADPIAPHGQPLQQTPIIPTMAK